jgi:hypothetical protein
VALFPSSQRARARGFAHTFLHPRILRHAIASHVCRPPAAPASRPRHLQQHTAKMQTSLKSGLVSGSVAAAGPRKIIVPKAVEVTQAPSLVTGPGRAGGRNKVWLALVPQDRVHCLPCSL